MKKKTTRKPPTAVLILAVAVITAVSFAVAWLTIGDEILDRTYKLSNFDAYAEVYFMDGPTKITPTKSSTFGTVGAIEVDVNNESAPNYIGKLRVDAHYKGKGKAYLRLRVVQQWLKDGDIIQSNAVLPYTIAAPYNKGVDEGNQVKWFDNRADDYCLYYATPVQGNDNVTVMNLPVITGLDEAEFNASAPLEGGTTTLRLSFELQMVQVNRYPQFWGISALPWLED